MAADTELETFMMEMEQSATLLVRQNHQRRVKQARTAPFDVTKVRKAASSSGGSVASVASVASARSIVGSALYVSGESCGL